jgi:ribulose bisphosphate carboxylase small subunit
VCDLTTLILNWLLPNNFVRIFVFPDSKKDRVTETIIPRPFSEFYLADHHDLTHWQRFVLAAVNP